MAVKLTCTDLERVLLGQDPGLLQIMADHARGCPGCSDELTKWSAISEAARSMHKDWETPGLWPAIRQGLAVETGRRWRFPTLSDLFAGLAGNWRFASGALVMAVISTSMVWLLVQRSESTSDTIRQISENRLLTEQALREVEDSEAAYQRSIDRLLKLVKPKIQDPRSPLLTNYHEKLKLLDAAIVECRANVDQNRFNAHLRLELLALYQEKQHTLKELIKEEHE